MPVVIFLCSVLLLKQMWDFNIRCLHHIKKKSKKKIDLPTHPDFFHERANKQTHFFLALPKNSRIMVMKRFGDQLYIQLQDCFTPILYPSYSLYIT